MSENRQAAKLLKRLTQLQERRGNDKYTGDFPQEVARPGKPVAGVLTLAKRVLQPCTPLVSARFRFAGAWENASLGIAWLSPSGMKQALTNRQF